MQKTERRNIAISIAAVAIGALLLMAYLPATATTLGSGGGITLGVSFQPATILNSITYNGVDVTSKSLVLTLTGAIATSGGVSVTSWSISGNLVITTAGKTFSTSTIAASGTGAPPASIPVSINGTATGVIPMSKFGNTAGTGIWGFSYGTQTISFTGNPTLTVHFSDGTTSAPVYTNVNLGSITMSYTSSATAVLTLNPVVVTTQALAWLTKLR